MHESEELYEDEDLGPSRSQKKREMIGLQKLAEKLMKLSPELVKKCGLPDYFIEEVLDAINISAHEAKRRKVQYVGKLMRNINPQPLIDFLEDIETGNRADNLKFHRLEKWRDALVDGDMSILNAILDEYPDADRQRIAQLSRNAKNEKKKGKPAKSAKALFKTLRELTE